MSNKLLELLAELGSFINRKKENEKEEEILKQEECELGLGWRRVEEDLLTSNEDEDDENDDGDDGLLVPLY